MRRDLKIIMVTILVGMFVLACQKEDSKTVADPNTLGQSSALTAKLIALTYPRDIVEITDDRIDNSSCFKIKLPFSVSVNGQLLTISSEADYGIVTQILDASLTNEDQIALTFPITVIYSRQPINQEVVISSQQQFEVLQNDCTAPNANTSCLNIGYPITIFSYNSEFQTQSTYVITNNDQFFQYLTNIGSDCYQLNYPVQTTNDFGDTATITNNDEFIVSIDEAVTHCYYDTSACRAYILNQDLVMYIPFANQVKDLTTFGNPVPTNQNYHFVSDRSGNANAAFSLDAGADANSIQTTFNANNNLIQSDGFAISLWFNRQNAAVSGPEKLFHTNGIEIGLGANNSTPQIRSPYVTVSGLSTPLVDLEWTQSMEGEINIWHHIVLTYDGQLLKFYRDGVLRSASVNAQFDGLIGGGVFGNDYIGYLDDIRMYKRALSYAEVQLLNNIPGENNQCND